MSLLPYDNSYAVNLIVLYYIVVGYCLSFHNRYYNLENTYAFRTGRTDLWHRVGNLPSLNINGGNVRRLSERWWGFSGIAYEEFLLSMRLTHSRPFRHSLRLYPSFPSSLWLFSPAGLEAQWLQGAYFPRHGIFYSTLAENLAELRWLIVT